MLNKDCTTQLRTSGSATRSLHVLKGTWDPGASVLQMRGIQSPPTSQLLM